MSEEKLTKIVQIGPWLSSYYRKSQNFDKSNKGHIITNITGKFHSGFLCSSCFYG